MRKFLALVLTLVMTLALAVPGASAKTGFADDAQISENCSEAVEVLSSIGILAGYESESGYSYRPRAVLTRGAGAKIVAYLVLGRAVADKLNATYTVFSDVTGSVSLASYIEWAAAAGIVDGYADGRFRPYDKLTEYAFGKMLLTALGYVSAEEGFTGSGWQQRVSIIATACGVFDGTETYGACNRETAARMAFGALQAHIVVYGRQIRNLWTQDGTAGAGAPASEQLLNAWVGVISEEGACQTAETLADRYGLVKKAGPDSWGRPGHFWAYGEWEEFFPDPVRACYHSAVTQCDAADDLGIDWTKRYTTYTNGARNEGVQDITASQTVETIGAEGRLTEVYDNVIVYIDTFLGEVTEVSARTYDASGHVRTPASLTVAIYSAGHVDSGLPITKTSVDSDFAYSVGDRLAVHKLTGATYLKSDGEAYPYTVAGVLDPVTVTVDAIVTDAGNSAVALVSGGVRYYYNSTFAGVRLSTGDIGSVCKLYLDDWGNVLALEKAAAGAPSGYGVVTAIDTERLGVGRYLIVAEVLQANGATAAMRFENSERKAPYETQNAAEADAQRIGTDVLIRCEDTDGDGWYDVWAKADANSAATVYRGRTDTLDGGVLVDDETVFFVANYSFDYAKGAYVSGGYSVIRGFKNIKELANTAGSFENGDKSGIEVSTLADSNAVLVLYANRQSTPAAQPVDHYAYLITDRFVTIGSDYKIYNAIIDGVSGQSLRVTAGTGAQISATGLYIYDKNAADVNGWNEVTAANRTIARNTYSYEKGVLTYGSGQYLTVADNAAVYIINPTSGSSVRGSLSNLSKAMYGTVCDIEYQLDADGYVSLFYIVENAGSYTPAA
ncbi:MAG: S-layer homology domain-containing protein [Oscillospiraceae bacterium]